MENEIYLYISRWALRGGAPGMGLFAFNTDTGAIRLLRVLDDSRSFDFSVIDHEKNILYVVNETNLKEETGYDTGRVYGFRINPENGDLTELFRQDTYCPFPDYLGFSEDGRYLVVPHHSWATCVTRIVRDEKGEYRPEVQWMDSAIDLFSMKEDGTIDRLVDVVKHQPQGQMHDYEGKATIPHPHCAARSPKGDFYVVCDKGECRVYCYKLDQHQGKLIPWQRTGADPELNEPRLCAFHPTKPWFYVNYEHSARTKCLVRGFDYSRGGMDLITEADCLPEGHVGRSEGQGFCINAAGTHLYNQVADLNAIVVLAIDQETGALSVQQRVPIEGTRARSCALSPDGRFLVNVCLGGEIAVYAVEPDGSLRPTPHREFLKGSAYASFYLGK